MAHEVWFEVPQRELGRADIKFGVWQDGKKIGTLEVSKGSVVWIRGKPLLGPQDRLRQLRRHHGEARDTMGEATRVGDSRPVPFLGGRVFAH